MARSYESAEGILRVTALAGTLEGVDEEQGIYRGEVIEIMGAVADIRVDVRKILWYIEGDDDDEWEETEEEENPPGDA